jgi:3-hydroxybutyryl-CoA dehydrogenase
MLAIETVAVLGRGDDTLDVAVLSALAGCEVRLHDPDPSELDRAAEQVRYRVELAIEMGLLTRGDRQRILDGILFTADLAEAATAADLVIGLASDQAEAAAALTHAVDLARATTPLATLTVAGASGLAGAVPHPGRVLALGVERDGGLIRLLVLAAPGTARHTLVAVEAFAARANGLRARAR